MKRYMNKSRLTVEQRTIWIWDLIYFRFKMVGSYWFYNGNLFLF